jgi:ribose transport system substrate-binding protein
LCLFPFGRQRLDVGHGLRHRVADVVNAGDMVGGWPLRHSSQTLALIQELQTRKLKVAAIDALPEQLIYVEKGLVPVLWAQPNYMWGKVGVETIVDKVARKKSVPERIRLELVRVSRQNLGTWARQLQAWGFTGIPAEYLKLE